MRKPCSFRNSVVVIGTIGFAACLIVISLQAGEQKTKSNTRDVKVSTQMIGAWELKEKNRDGEVRLKFFTGKNWAITEADKNGKVIFHHGGTYKIDGDNYTETIEYANENTADMIGNTYKFKVKVEGDTYTQTATDNNPFSESWQRIK